MTTTLEDRVDKLEDAVKDLNYHYRTLDKRQDDLDASIKGLSAKFDEFKKEALQIVKDASTNTPRWLMSLIVSILLVMVLANAGWVIEQIALHH